jgi:hypothetical protein
LKDGVKPYVKPGYDLDDLVTFIEERLAAHEGGAGDIRIGYDDATFDYVISQRNLTTKSDETLGCSRSLWRAIELAVTRKRYD